MCNIIFLFIPILENDRKARRETCAIVRAEEETWLRTEAKNVIVVDNEAIEVEVGSCCKADECT